MAFRKESAWCGGNNIDFKVDHLVIVRGAYCIICELAEDACIKVGSLGKANFPRGAYVYVGSAQNGIESRVSRHRASKKKRKWHIDYFLDKAEVQAVIAVPSEDKKMECELAKAMMAVANASIPLSGFGSSDCACDSHLIYFGDEDLESVAEAVVYRLSMLTCAYPERAPDSKGKRPRKR